MTLLEHWLGWGRRRSLAPEELGYTRLPVLRAYKLGPGEDRVPLWKGAWEAAGEHAFVLESGKGGRYTYLGLRPDAVIRGNGGSGEVKLLRLHSCACGENGSGWVDGGADETEGLGTEVESRSGKPLELLRAWLARERAPRAEGEGLAGPHEAEEAGIDIPPFAGGAVGYLSYDVARSLERLPQLARDDLELPDYAFLLINEVWIVDHLRSELICSFHPSLPDSAWEDERELAERYEEASAHVDNMKAEWDRIMAAATEPEAVGELEAMKRIMAEDGLQMDIEAYSGIRTAMTKDEFKEAVRAVQRYISQGDVFQVNLSNRQSRAVATKPEELYEWLRLVNPSPYMGFMRFPDFQLVSASPELLVKLDGKRMSARPIAGTRRRGRTEEEDLKFADELLTSEKERAEHIMLVDLERNDLGRVAAYGTVRVPELLTIERYSHVMHLVSQVEGTIAPGKDAFDLLAAAFPGGTITGAPKIRTMEIIEELEPVRRGPYTGSLGWIDYAGNMEFNIIIRTIAAKDGQCHIQAGAGIVIDSDPEREFYECLNKAKALWKAVEYGERRHGEAQIAAPC
ncbi:anthranilate synthase component I family protein [Cohnella fermenti]|uniref:Anthranilate synthase component I family protein n=1 Tax=Cohnella fermenti TaxID=2565925 RepID=A0A4S4BL61_9BACL|nr:anthranilate synthase component I family protein [Cohnella fermenti]THF74533.1 anthranilate synthase component I family protein [Cohnella fermenti]